jgi:hypothetical protein
MRSEQYTFIRKNEEGKDTYYLIELWEDGNMSLKVKDLGWSDVWSLPLDKCDYIGRVHKEAQE